MYRQQKHNDWQDQPHKTTSEVVPWISVAPVVVVAAAALDARPEHQLPAQQRDREEQL
jgi:hypothetical protein